MNLLSEAWIPAVRRDGQVCRIAPWQIAETENPVVELQAPRPDFQGGLYQFLIGLLQTCFSPKDVDAWEDLYLQPPATDTLKSNFQKAGGAFELFSDVGKPAFLQDLLLDEGEQKPLTGLLIEAPGGKTLKDNLDFFVKGGQVEQVCGCCTAQALFTLQTNAPSGGVGHRVGLRGGGPLTTLLQPGQGDATLWQKLWLNVLYTENQKDLIAEQLDASVFPWLAETRYSDKTGQATLPDDVHHLQMYWGMPRRIRLEKADHKGVCDLCGDASEQLYSHYRTKNYGVNYDGPWFHPLTPYRLDPKHVKPPLSLKGQKGGLSYRNWLGLLFCDDDNGDQAAEIVKQFFADKFVVAGTAKSNGDGAKELRLWCFGFDMDNMKARCWYDHQLPVFSIPPEQSEKLQSLTGELLAGAKDTASLLRQAVKEAWFRRPKDHSGDMSFVDADFWSKSEAGFYQVLRSAVSHLEQSGVDEVCYKRWYNILLQTCETVFDEYALGTTVEDLDLKRVILARSALMKKFHSPKLKTLHALREKAGLNDKKENAHD